MLVFTLKQMPMSTCQPYACSNDFFFRDFLTRLSQIELKAEDLYDKEKVDLETIIIDDVFKLLQCEPTGLTDEESTRRLGIFGPNRLESEEQNAFLQVSCPTLKLKLGSLCFSS